MTMMIAEVPLEENTEYLIRQLSGKRAISLPPEGLATFQIAKFESGSNTPVSVYEVEWHTLTLEWTCNCPSFPRVGQKDKHIQLVKEWIKAGQPSKIDLHAIDKYLAKARLAELGIEIEAPDWDDFESEARDLLIYLRRKDIDNVVQQLSRLNDIALQFVDKSLLPNVASYRQARSAVDALIDAVVPTTVSGLVGRWMIMKAITWLMKNKFMSSSAASGLLNRSPFQHYGEVTPIEEELQVPPVDASRIWRAVQKFLEEHDISWENLRDLMLEANMTDKDLIQSLFDRIVSDEAITDVVGSQLTDFLKLHPEVDLEPMTPTRAARTRKLVAAVVTVKRRPNGQIQL